MDSGHRFVKNESIQRQLKYAAGLGMIFMLMLAYEGNCCVRKYVNAWTEYTTAIHFQHVIILGNTGFVSFCNIQPKVVC